MADRRTTYLNHVQLSEALMHGCKAACFLAYLRYKTKHTREVDIGPQDVPWLGEKALRNIRAKLGNSMFKAVKSGKIYTYSDVVDPALLAANQDAQSRPFGGEEQEDGSRPFGGIDSPFGGIDSPKVGISGQKGGINKKEEEVKEETTNAHAREGSLGWQSFAETFVEDGSNSVVTPPDFVTPDSAPAARSLRRPSYEIGLEDVGKMRYAADQRRRSSGSRARKADTADLEAKVDDLSRVYPSPTTDRGAAVKALQDALTTSSFEAILAAAKAHGAARDAQYLTGLHRWLSGSMFRNPAPAPAGKAASTNQNNTPPRREPGKGPVTHTISTRI